MNVEYINVGRVCESLAGHDKGAFYVIVQVLDDRYVLVCDGKNRTLNKPKKKQVKHLLLKPQYLSSIADKLSNGKRVYDFEIVGALAACAERLTGKEG